MKIVFGGIFFGILKKIHAYRLLKLNTDFQARSFLAKKNANNWPISHILAVLFLKMQAIHCALEAFTLQNQNRAESSPEGLKLC